MSDLAERLLLASATRFTFESPAKPGESTFLVDAELVPIRYHGGGWRVKCSSKSLDREDGGALKWTSRGAGILFEGRDAAVRMALDIAEGKVSVKDSEW